MSTGTAIADRVNRGAVDRNDDAVRKAQRVGVPEEWRAYASVRRRLKITQTRARRQAAVSESRQAMIASWAADEAVQSQERPRGWSPSRWRAFLRGDLNLLGGLIR